MHLRQCGSLFILRRFVVVVVVQSIQHGELLADALEAEGFEIPAEM